MQIPFIHQVFSFSLAVLMTAGVLVGIDHQAQAQDPTADPLLAQVAAPKA